MRTSLSVWCRSYRYTVDIQDNPKSYILEDVTDLRLELFRRTPHGGSKKNTYTVSVGVMKD